MPKRSVVIAIVAYVVSCRNEPPPAPTPAQPPPAKPAVVAPADAGSPPSAQPGTGSGSAIAYRAADATFHVDPSVVGTGKTYVAVSESVQATAVGKQVLADGGDAVDAAVAIELALAVVHPSAGNLAGGGFAVVRTDSGARTALDFRETAPAAATRDMYIDPKTNKPRPGASTTGYLSVATPAEVAGLYALHKRLGKKPWKDVVAPAIALARDGFVVDERTRRVDWPPRRLPRQVPGDRSDLAARRCATRRRREADQPRPRRVLQRIAERGPEGFATARPPTHRRRDEARRRAVTAADLAAYQSRCGARRSSPPTAAHVHHDAAAVVGRHRARDDREHAARHRPPRVGWHSTEHVHRIVEALRRAFAARNELLGDPDFVPGAGRELLSTA